MNKWYRCVTKKISKLLIVYLGYFSISTHIPFHYSWSWSSQGWSPMPTMEKPCFVSRIDQFIVDEAHCASQWSSFHLSYKELSWLYPYLCDWSQWYLTSATLDPPTCSKILKEVGMASYHQKPGFPSTTWICRSNDWGNLHYCVKKWSTVWACTWTSLS